MAGSIMPFFLILVAALFCIICMGTLSDQIGLLMRHHAPNFGYDGTIFLFWSLSVWTAFTAGLMVMYVMLTD